MMTLPLVLRADRRQFVVIGGGAVATRKIQTLVKAGCHPRVISPQVSAEVQALADSGAITLNLEKVGFDQAYPAGAFVVLATDDAEVNKAQADLAKQLGALICRVDDQEGNDFIFPAVVDRSPLLISISSSGASPALTRHIKQRLEAFLPQQYGHLANVVESLRAQVKSVVEATKRPSFWRRWMQSQAPDLILAKQEAKADEITQALLAGEQPSRGEAFLVGAGPGDPDLLTFRALRLIQSADVVFYDRLVNPAIMEFLSPDAERFYVGKARSDHSVPQDGINQLLVQEAKKGKRVLRLKGGDPFIFGRGGEEIEELAAAGVPFQVVPGITAASGCSAYAGIPLTHRDHAQSVRFVTGHLKNGTCDLPWGELIHPSQTLVIYMGLAGLPHICQQLIAHNMPAATPIALVEKGTLPDQKVHVATLETMPSYIETHDIQAPTLTIVGSVVALHETLKWR
ncbi:uroporphyrinogen-III C-methyltransferase [Thalassolituus oleivorans]|uniref:siroheme synthase CysG n=1 Tax=Thalassolituus oleivorans TaxID=187493 RepID=UPI000949356D|nr:siroheme synthase CysG [Thalassolituus oleivorans]APR67126.1 uroporphyrinogen-III C-methyltransferase [Thalassolituus oleivorans]